MNANFSDRPDARHKKAPVISRGFAWAWMDGAAQGEQSTAFGSVSVTAQARNRKEDPMARG